MKKLFLTVTLVLTFTFQAFGIDGGHVKAEAKNGDGIITLLQRYRLHQHQCNYQEFYVLNGLNPDDQLIKGKSYFLPINSYAYNGENIRSTIGIENWDQAVAIQNYNELMVSLGLKSQDYRDGSVLWVPHHLYPCYKEDPPAVEASLRIKNFSLFGSDYEEVIIKSDQLKDRVFYLKSGHGGPDPGAISQYKGNQICEDEYVYDVTLRLARRLMEHNAKVVVLVEDPFDGIRNDKILPCDHTEVHYGGKKIPINQLQRLKDRAEIINRLYRENKKKGFDDQMVISIHIDSNINHHRQDVYFYHYHKSSKGKRIAHQMQDIFRKKYGIHRSNGRYRGTVSGRNLYILRTTHPPAVLVELANINNSNDQKRFILPSNRQALADWMFEGLANITP